MVNTILTISVVLILLSILLSLYRFIKGPNTADRVIAFDVMTIASIGLIGLIAYFDNRIVYLDVAVVYGLLSFIGVIVVAKFLEKSL
ncbi:cation:proton antiporter [Prolixibacter bellariivorans]|jgi:multicomponent Na+:H+ antiporter subunit F|uniref:Cation:proton antiporter n=1 Tax=Prolixibacter bellariivorans TaxID=314319 RepID=A0A5M4B1I8_9BACT|nr:monovalent cation/H+ antiporter complex subunit F [Prolixibacter bellariivorans]GET34022.1 cation:proton antiporter [Prolixibacter bellariivorans]